MCHVTLSEEPSVADRMRTPLQDAEAQVSRYQHGRDHHHHEHHHHHNLEACNNSTGTALLQMGQINIYDIYADVCYPTRARSTAQQLLRHLHPGSHLSYTDSMRHPNHAAAASDGVSHAAGSTQGFRRRRLLAAQDAEQVSRGANAAVGSSDEGAAYGLQGKSSGALLGCILCCEEFADSPPNRFHYGPMCACHCTDQKRQNMRACGHKRLCKRTSITQRVAGMTLCL